MTMCFLHTNGTANRFLRSTVVRHGLSFPSGTPGKGPSGCAKSSSSIATCSAFGNSGGTPTRRIPGRKTVLRLRTTCRSLKRPVMAEVVRCCDESLKEGMWLVGLALKLRMKLAGDEEREIGRASCRERE